MASFFLSFIIFGCSHAPVVLQEIKPAQSYSILHKGTTASKRTGGLTLSVEYVDRDNFFILNSDTGVLKESFSSTILDTEVFLFQITVQNRSTENVRVKDVSMSYDLEMGKATIEQRSSDSLNSSRFSGLNRSAFFEKRIIHGTETSIYYLDYNADTTLYNFDFILPGDTLLFYAAFDKPSIEVRNFSIEITLSENDEKKVVDLPFVWSENSRQLDVIPESRYKDEVY